jgi:hypothetical protein
VNPVFAFIILCAIGLALAYFPDARVIAAIVGVYFVLKSLGNKDPKPTDVG